MKVKMNRIVSKHFVFLTTILLFGNFTDTVPKISLDFYEPEIQKVIEKNLSLIQKNLIAKSLNEILQLNIFNAQGKEKIIDLLNKNNIEFIENQEPLEIIEEKNGFQVRDIAITKTSKCSNMAQRQFLIFNFDRKGIITDVRYSINNQYEFINFPVVLSPKDRENILAFLERYKTAYINGNISTIKTMFDTCAEIFVGKVEDIDFDYNNQSINNNVSVQLRDLDEYTTRLKSVFNNDIQLEFEDYDIHFDEYEEELYGIFFHQKWRSLNYNGKNCYNDKGWIYLLVDFKDKDKPLICRRRWSIKKPEPETYVKSD